MVQGAIGSPAGPLAPHAGPSRPALQRLKSVDFYRKLPTDLTEATLSGAAISIATTFIILFLLGAVRAAAAAAAAAASAATLHLGFVLAGMQQTC